MMIRRRPEVGISIGLVLALGTLLASQRFARAQESPQRTTCTPVAGVDIANPMVYSLAYSPDGKQIATAGRARAVHLLRADTLKDDRTLEGSLGSVYKIDFLPDGLSLIGAGGDGAVRVWEVASGKEVKVYGDHQGAVLGLGVSPDGHRIFAGARAKLQGEILIRDLETGQARPFSPSYHVGIEALDLSRDGRSLVTGGTDGTVRVWDVDSGVEKTKIVPHGNKPVSRVVLAPNGLSIASTGSDLKVAIFNVASGREVRNVPLSGRWIAGLAFSPDSSLLALTDTDKIRLLETTTFTEVGSVSLPGRHCNALSFAPDGRTLAVGGAEGLVRTFSVRR